MTSCSNSETVDMSHYIIPDSIDVDKVIEELSFGKEGYVVMEQLFTKEEIQLARNTVLKLIDEEGPKATHFQVFFRRHLDELQFQVQSCPLVA